MENSKTLHNFNDLQTSYIDFKQATSAKDPVFNDLSLPSFNDIKQRFGLIDTVPEAFKQATSARDSLNEFKQHFGLIDTTIKSNLKEVNICPAS